MSAPLEAREVIQRVVDASTRNPHTGVYIGCDHYRMRAAVKDCEAWLAAHPAPQPVTASAS